MGWADVSIQNRDTGLWWNDVSRHLGSVHLEQRRVHAGHPLGEPHAWSYAYAPPAAGNYRVGVRARDNDGRVDATPAWVNFSVSCPAMARPDHVAIGVVGPTLPPGRSIQGRHFSWHEH